MLLATLRTILLAATVASVALPVRAQLALAKQEDVKLARSLPLIVLLEEDDPDKLKKLAKKPGALEEYRQNIANNNARLQRLVPKYWKFSSEISFQSQADQEKLLQDRSGKCCILSCKSLKGQHKQRAETREKNLPGNSANGIRYEYYTVEDERLILLELIANGHSRRLVAKQLPVGTTDGDVILMLKTIQQYLLDIEQGKSDVLPIFWTVNRG
ncbi:MAG: hypothetical protein H7330_01370 [Hymenobacteraceae bacterium]|nr:hypothetical protein [Hymenobacteraceae bacterium]